MSKDNTLNKPTKVVLTTETINKLDLVEAAVSATCRMVVPVFGLFIVGLVIDAVLKQNAFYGIIGAIVGFFVAGWLVRRQLKAYEKNASKSKTKGSK